MIHYFREAKKSPDAAQWFYDYLPNSWLNQDFSFGINEVEIIGSDPGSSSDEKDKIVEKEDQKKIMKNLQK